ncbi:hypothetical protein GCM10018987_07530 [Streptomyces cremeus]
MHGQAVPDALGEPHALPQVLLGAHQVAAPALEVTGQDVREGEVAAAPARFGERPAGLSEQGLGAVELVGEGVTEAQQCGRLEAPGEVRPAQAVGEAAVDQGAVADLHDGLPVLADGGRVERAQHQQGLLGGVPARDPGGRLLEPEGSGGAVALGGVHALPEELHGLQAHPQRSRRCGGRRLGHHLAGLGDLVVVRERLGQQEHRVGLLLVGQPRLAEGRLQVLGGVAGRAEGDDLAQFVLHLGEDGGRRRLLQRPLQTQPGGVRRADRDVLPVGGAHLLDQLRVGLRRYVHEVAGRFGRAAPLPQQHVGDDAVQGLADPGGDGLVDGRGDGGVDELQVLVLALEDAGVAQPLGAGDRLLDADRHHLRGALEGDVGLHDGDGEREAEGVAALGGEPLHQPLGALGHHQRAQRLRHALDGVDVLFLGAGDERDGLEEVAARHRPHLPAERVVGVLAEHGAGETGRAVRAERAQQEVRARPAHGGVEFAQQGRGLALGLVGPVRGDQQQGQLADPGGERDQPAQGLQVAPLQVVDDQDQRAVVGGEPADQGVEAVPDALRVGVHLAAGRGDAERGGDAGVPVAQQAARRPADAREGGLQQLAYDVEGDGGDRLAAAGGPDDAVAGAGEALDLREEGGLADAGDAAEQQDAATGEGVAAQGVEGPRGRFPFRVAFDQLRGGRWDFRPGHGHSFPSVRRNSERIPLRRPLTTFFRISPAGTSSLPGTPEGRRPRRGVPGVRP